MLVLSRKRGERITIEGVGEITITVVDIHKGKVRIGIDAPKDVTVIRSEIRDDD